MKHSAYRILFPLLVLLQNKYECEIVLRIQVTYVQAVSPGPLADVGEPGSITEKHEFLCYTHLPMLEEIP